MRILIVKLSSLGDVVHALPVVADIRAAHPGATIDWVVEPAFAPLLRRVRGIGNVIELPLRRWSRAGWCHRATLVEARAFVRRLRRDSYDAVIDLQGLTKSAIVAVLARGPSYGLANRTEGASHEGPARWLVTHAIRVETKSHALDRSRELVSRALHTRTDSPPSFGLAAVGRSDADRVVFIHGTSRDDKLWPEERWIELGQRLVGQGHTIALPQSGSDEQARAARIAAAIGDAAEVWPAMDLDALVDRMAGTAGAIGVDSGPSHIAVALDLPHVQIYNQPTAWRTGPQERHGHRHQVSIEVASGPTIEAVWAAWRDVDGRPPALPPPSRRES
ncbi:MAG: lipopolysaccharide heptosyltransferase I [Caldimonas sp.]